MMRCKNFLICLVTFSVLMFPMPAHADLISGSTAEQLLADIYVSLSTGSVIVRMDDLREEVEGFHDDFNDYVSNNGVLGTIKTDLALVKGFCGEIVGKINTTNGILDTIYQLDLSIHTHVNSIDTKLNGISSIVSDMTALEHYVGDLYGLFYEKIDSELGYFHNMLTLQELIYNSLSNLQITVNMPSGFNVNNVADFRDVYMNDFLREDVLEPWSRLWLGDNVDDLFARYLGGGNEPSDIYSLVSAFYDERVDFSNVLTTKLNQILSSINALNTNTKLQSLIDGLADIYEMMDGFTVETSDGLYTVKTYIAGAPSSHSYNSLARLVASFLNNKTGTAGGNFLKVVTYDVDGNPITGYFSGIESAVNSLKDVVIAIKAILEIPDDVFDLIGDFSQLDFSEKIDELADDLQNLAPFGAVFVLADFVSLMASTNPVADPSFDFTFGFTGQNQGFSVSLAWLNDARMLINFICIALLTYCLAVCSMKFLRQV